MNTSELVAVPEPTSTGASSAPTIPIPTISSRSRGGLGSATGARSSGHGLARGGAGGTADDDGEGTASSPSRPSSVLTRASRKFRRCSTVDSIGLLLREPAIAFLLCIHSTFAMPVKPLDRLAPRGGLLLLDPGTRPLRGHGRAGRRAQQRIRRVVRGRARVVPAQVCR